MTRERSGRDGESIDRRRLLRSVSVAGAVAIAGCADEADSSDGDDEETTDENDASEDSEDDEREFDGTDADGNEDGGETEGETDDADDEGDHDDGTVRFLLDANEEQADIVDEFTPLAEYLEAETDTEIELVRAADSDAARTRLENGDAELAAVSPIGVLLAEDADIVGVRRAFGSAYFFSTITTTPDSDIERLDDLEGETVALGPRASLSSAFVPAKLLSEAGLDVGTYPDGDPVDLEVRTGHSTIEPRLHLLREDDIVAAGTPAFAVAPQVPRRQFDEYPAFVERSAEYEGAGEAIGDEPELQLLAVSEPLPRAPIAARSDWTGPVREAIEDALLRVGPNDLRPDGADPELWFTGVEDADRGDYQPYADLFDELEIEPEAIV